MRQNRRLIILYVYEVHALQRKIHMCKRAVYVSTFCEIIQVICYNVYEASRVTN